MPWVSRTETAQKKLHDRLVRDDHDEVIRRIDTALQRLGEIGRARPKGRDLHETTFQVTGADMHRLRCLLRSARDRI